MKQPIAKEKVVLLFRELSKSEVSQLRAEKGNLILVKYASIDIDPALERAHSIIEIDTELIQEFSDLHFNEVINLGKLKIGDKHINEHLSFDANTLWLYLKFTVNQRSLNPFLQYKITDFQLNRYPNSKVEVYTDLKVKADHENREIKYHLADKKKSSFFSKVLYLFSYLTLFLLRVLLGSINNGLNFKKFGPHFILDNEYNYQHLIRPSGKGKLYADPHLGYLIEKTVEDKRFTILSQMRVVNLNSNYPLKTKDHLLFLKSKKAGLVLEPFIFKAFFKSTFLNKKREIDSILKRFQDEYAKFEDTLSIEHRIIVSTLIGSSRLLSQTALREVAAKMMYDKTNIKSLTLIDEHSPKNRSIWLPLSEHNVKIVAVQHGAISDRNIAYRFCGADKSYNAIPALSLFRGEYTKNQLIRDSIYQEEDIRLVGHMRTDVIPNLLEKANSTHKNNPTILYATQTFQTSDRALKLKIHEDFFSVCKQMPQLNFVLKPHPNEKNDDLYHELIKAYDLKNLSVEKGDLYQILSKVDLVITYYSTVGIEALYFGKELITTDYNRSDPQSYIKEEVCHNVQNANELRTTIEDVLSNRLAIDQEKREIFIRKRVYRIDGKTTKRHLEAILS